MINRNGLYTNYHYTRVAISPAFHIAPGAPFPGKQLKCDILPKTHRLYSLDCPSPPAIFVTHLCCTIPPRIKAINLSAQMHSIPPHPVEWTKHRGHIKHRNLLYTQALNQGNAVMPRPYQTSRFVIPTNDIHHKFDGLSPYLNIAICYTHRP